LNLKALNLLNINFYKKPSRIFRMGSLILMWKTLSSKNPGQAVGTLKKLLGIILDV